MAQRLKHVKEMGLLARFSLVALVVSVLVAGGMAWFIQGEMSTLLLNSLASRDVGQVSELALNHTIVADDFVAPHTPEQLASIAARLDPVSTDMQADDTSIIRLQMFATDGTVLYSDLPDKRGQQIDLDDEDDLTDALHGEVAREVSDLAGEENRELKARFDQALEVYAPIEINGQVVGAFEVYQDLGPAKAIAPLVWGSVLGGFTILFAALLGVVYTAAVRIRRQQQRLAHHALHDALTDLPNRALFLDRLGHTLARRGADPVAVLCIKIDGRQLVKDSLGHAAGDELLIRSAERLLGAVAAVDTVARVGEDELSVLLEEVHGISAAVSCAESLLASLSAQLTVNNHELFPSASIGISLSTSQVRSAEDVLRAAGAATTRAAENGGGRYEIFEGRMALRASTRLTLETELRRALDRGELCLHYQPILSLVDGRVVEVEALARWNHTERGPIPPAEFIPVAEDTGLIVPLGQWVLEEACRQAAAWYAELGDRAPLMGVNLSARQFQRKELMRDISRALESADLHPSRLKVEITESVLMADAESTLQTLSALRGLGVRLAIDDFGTGYSSLAYLKRFPVDTLKLDRSFVAGLGDDPHDTAIVSSVVALARALDLSVTAEGIETEAQHQHLRALACARGQGFLFARPGPPDTLQELLHGRGHFLTQAA